MSSESSLKLPVIDFSEINHVKSFLAAAAAADDNDQVMIKWNSVRTQVIEALEKYGCFEVVYDSRDSFQHHEQKVAVYDAAEEVFNLPLETKLKNSVPGRVLSGYIAKKPQAPFFESMSIHEAHILEKAESFTRVMWPEGNAKICKALHSYSKQLLELDQMLRRMILESFGVENYYNEHIESTRYAFKLHKYEAPETSEDQISLGNHTDTNMVTILSQLNQVDGLEVQMKTGEWINAKPSPNSFIVMLGDAMMVWTNGRLSPPFHRVMMTGDETRYVAGLFSIPKADCMVKTPEELVDEEHPLLYKPYYHDEFYAYLYKVNGYARSNLALKDFCGV